MLLANSEGQELKQHCRAVGIIAGRLAEVVLANSGESNKGIVIEQARLAGYLHDIGKADPAFQRFIKRKARDSEVGDDDDDHEGNDKKEWIFHNQISWLSLDEIFRANNKAAVHAIYHHHDPGRNREIPNGYMVPDACSRMFADMRAEYRAIHGEPGACNLEGHVDTTKYHLSIPEFTIALTCLIQADRWVSQIGARLNEIELDLDGNFCGDFINYRDGADEDISHIPPGALHDYQTDVLQRINNSNSNTFVVDGPAGCGKTAISIAFCNSFGANQYLFVAPRNTICQSLYETIDDDLQRMSMDKSRELITACAQQNRSEEVEELEADITIINIDSVLRSYFVHNRKTNLIKFLTKPMVLDEYHELNTCKGALLHVARCLISAREYVGAKTLLISATPVDILYDLRTGRYGRARAVIPHRIGVSYPEWLDTTHEFEVVKEFEEGKPDTWYRRNTINALQDSFIGNGLVLHSRYDEIDRVTKLKICQDHYKKDGPGGIAVHSSPMIECSLNVSFKHAELEVASPESLIQSLGRVERFGQTCESKIKIVVENKLSPANGTYLGIVYSRELGEAWRKWVLQHFNSTRLKKSEARELYHQFNLENNEVIKALIKNNCDSSERNLTAVRHRKGAGKKGNNQTISDGNLRGTSGCWTAFFFEGNNGLRRVKLWVASDNDMRHIRNEVGEVHLTKMKRALVTQTPEALHGGDTAQFNCKALFERSRNLELVFRAAKKRHQAIPLQSGELKKAFEYDRNPDINSNVGIIKLVSGSLVQTEQMEDEE